MMEVTKEILVANKRFYDAFSSSDFNAMEKIWANAETITCIHPGWPSLNTRNDVLSSWRSILSNQSLFVGVSDEEVHVFGDTAYVICHEHLEPGTLVATNIFSREGERWQLVHHQSGLTSSQLDDDFLDGHPTIQ
jgi:ketosteroid isomerase-like protein